MAATVSGSKTVSNAVAPHLSGATITTLLATPVENLTVAQFKQIADALSRLKGGNAESTTLGSLFS